MAKNNKRRGFTLVELIVVLVILAILAALLVPALTGYIDKAKKNQVIAETRMLTQAAQTELSTLYATDEFQKAAASSTTTLTVASQDGSSMLPNRSVSNLSSRYSDIVSLAELSSLTNGSGSFFIVADFTGAIQWTVYSDGKGYYGIFCKEDGSMTAFTKDELPHYNYAYGDFVGKIVCTKIEDTYKNPTTGIIETRKMWSKNSVFAFLGVKGYTPDGWN